jgi:hypothetical protein
MKLEGKDEHVRRQLPPSSSIPTMPLTSGGSDLRPNNNLFLSLRDADEEQLTIPSTQLD